MMPPKRIRPGRATEADRKSKTGEDRSSAPTVADIADVQEFADRVDGVFVIVVKITGGTLPDESGRVRYRRRCFLTLKAAEDAARRATDAGYNAVIVLAELKAVYRVIGGGDHE